MNPKHFTGFLALAVLLVAGVLEFRKGDAPPVPQAPSETSQGQTPTTAAPKRAASVPQGAGFDFYVLSLSWSPTFCESGQARNGDPQCEKGNPRGFVVHGLWPQNESGYPQFCQSSEPERVPASIGRDLAAFMPSMGLIGHQWRKHGSCTGLSQKDYFSVLAAAWNRLEMPKQYADGRRMQNGSPNEIEDAFIAANPGLTPSAIAVTCEGRRLDEVRVCMTKDLQFRSCGEVERQACRIDKVTIPAAR